MHRNSENALFKQQSSWILDACDEMWQFFQRWTTGSSTHPLCDGSIALYMQLLETFAIPAPESINPSPHLRKAMLMAFSNVAHLIETLATASMSDDIQTQLALLVTRLCHFAQLTATHDNESEVRHGYWKDPDTGLLRQSATRICEQAEILSGLQKDLQVCAVREMFDVYD